MPKKRAEKLANTRAKREPSIKKTVAKSSSLRMKGGKKVSPKMKKEKLIGAVTHFYDRISVGIIKLKTPMKVGESVHFKGKKTDFTQPVVSMQFQHAAIEKAPKGKEVGVKVSQEVREGDMVYRT